MRISSFFALYLSTSEFQRRFQPCTLCLSSILFNALPPSANPSKPIPSSCSPLHFHLFPTTPLHSIWPPVLASVRFSFRSAPCYSLCSSTTGYLQPQSWAGLVIHCNICYTTTARIDLSSVLVARSPSPPLSSSNRIICPITYFSWLYLPTAQVCSRCVSALIGRSINLTA